MTPLEKARQLLHRFYISLPNNGSLSHGINCCDDRWKEGKQCALMAVDEILIIMNEEYFTGSEKIDYWIQVKEELEKL